MQNNIFSNIPVFTKIISILIGVLALLNVFSQETENYFALKVGLTVSPNYFIWNFLTAGYFEISVIGAFFSIFLLIVTGKILEPLWGQKEFFKFIFIINAVTGLGTFFLIFFLNIFIRSKTILYLPFCGFSGITAGFTVAFKQLMPENEVSFVFTTVRVKYLTGIYLLVSTIFLFFGAYQQYPFILLGIYFKTAHPITEKIINKISFWKNDQNQSGNVTGYLSHDSENTLNTEEITKHDSDSNEDMENKN
ncbi:placental protein [Anaeramoeba ignava]|uniref:Placental protein n=1 Tax=Anaeramoeba ignava TaxID=1746090 RepID=A0A9Q0RI44_ANAIG|nr:placental protein [Anaeramoeba ignava]